MYTYNELITSISGKYDEVKAQHDGYHSAVKTGQLPDGTYVAKSTAKTQWQMKKVPMRYLSIIKRLLEIISENNCELNEELENDIIAVGKPAGTKVYTVEVKKGDKLLELIKKHKDVKDIMAKIQSACERAGLTINLAKGIIE